MRYLAFLCSIIFNQLFGGQIFVIGDSHIGEFQGTRNCCLHYIGATTMHRVGRDQLSIVDLRKLDLKDGDTAIFVFGEIDVRHHIGRQKDKTNQTLDEIITTLATNYIQTILLNRSFFENIQCIIYSITPPVNIEGQYRYPTYGTLEDRIEIAKKLNNTLKSMSTANGIKFLDVYRYYANKNGSLKTSLSDGNVHINPKYNSPIRKALRKLL